MTAAVAVLMGSANDWRVLAATARQLDDLDVSYQAQVLSAHRMPHDLFTFGSTAAANGYRVVIAGAGGAAHLPGMLAATTTLPVIGVPIDASTLGGLDALLSIAQMPRGVPVATVAINGAANAAILAARILALTDHSLAERLHTLAAANETAARQSTAALTLTISSS